MTKPNALIHPFVEKGDTLTGPDGLTKREYFAAMAMQGILSNPDEAMRIPEAKMCSWATSTADALIDALNKIS